MQTLAFETTMSFGLIDFWEGCGEPLQLSYMYKTIAICGSLTLEWSAHYRGEVIRL